MKRTKDIIYIFVFICSFAFLLFSYHEAEATEPVELSYNEQIGLDFVEKPAKRNREQALEKIKELLDKYPEDLLSVSKRNLIINFLCRKCEILKELVEEVEDVYGSGE